jgi:hypothetical protein
VVWLILVAVKYWMVRVRECRLYAMVPKAAFLFGGWAEAYYTTAGAGGSPQDAAKACVRATLLFCFWFFVHFLTFAGPIYWAQLDSADD